MSVSKDLLSKTAAMEIVLIALLAEHRNDAAFWDRIERVRAVVWADLEKQLSPADLPMLVQLEDWLDTWRNVAAPEGRSVPPPAGA